MRLPKSGTTNLSLGWIKQDGYTIKLAGLVSPCGSMPINLIGDAECGWADPLKFKFGLCRHNTEHFIFFRIGTANAHAMVTPAGGATSRLYELIGGVFPIGGCVRLRDCDAGATISCEIPIQKSLIETEPP